jgi:hypothetical protein
MDKFVEIFQRELQFGNIQELELEYRLRPPHGCRILDSNIESIERALAPSSSFHKTTSHSKDTIWKTVAGGTRRWTQVFKEGVVQETALIEKKSVAHVDVDMPCGWSVRISLSRERQSTEDLLKITPPPTAYTREKRRVSYQHKKRFRVDITRVLSSDDRDCEEETIEVELELHNQNILFQETVSHCVDTGLAMVHDLLNFIMID